MIFATVGSHPEFRFERFLKALEFVPDGELVVQHGPGLPPANAARTAPWMEFGEIVAAMEQADQVVSHAGVGTILCAAAAGHVPIVFPRLRRYGETVDDHQVELARRLAGDGAVTVVENANELVAALAEAPPRGPRREAATGGLIEAVRAELSG